MPSERSSAIQPTHLALQALTTERGVSAVTRHCLHNLWCGLKKALRLELHSLLTAGSRPDVRSAKRSCKGSEVIAVGWHCIECNIFSASDGNRAPASAFCLAEDLNQGRLCLLLSLDLAWNACLDAG